MNEPIKIPFTPIKLSHQTPTDIKDCYIELLDTHLHYRCEFFADEPKDPDDLNMGWENVYKNWDIFALKRFVSGVEKQITSDKKWAIRISVSGMGDDIKIYSKLQAPTQELYDKLTEWLLK